MNESKLKVGDTNRLLPGLIYELASPNIGPPGLTPGGAKASKVPSNHERDREDFDSFSLRPGANPVPGYQLVSKIGQGKSGEVWRAIGPGGFPLAMKFVGMGERDASDEWHSLSLMRNIHHPNLITIFGTWEIDNLLIVGMELAEGTLLDLGSVAIDRGGKGLSFDELVAYLEQAARGVDFLNRSHHRHLDGDEFGLIHRDIKPENLLMVGGGVKVGDFGLVAKLKGSAQLHENESLAPAYVPPEWSEGRLSCRSDQYSLAMTFYRLATGSLPRPREATHELDLTALPEGQRVVVARALSQDPERRWPDCLTFVRELSRAGELEMARSVLSAEVELDRAPSSVLFEGMPKGNFQGGRLAAAAVFLMLLVIVVGRMSHRVEDGREPQPPAIDSQANRPNKDLPSTDIAVETVQLDAPRSDTVARPVDSTVTVAMIGDAIGAIKARQQDRLRQVLSPLGRSLASVDWKLVAGRPKVEASKSAIPPPEPVAVEAVRSPSPEVGMVQDRRPEPTVGALPAETPRLDGSQPSSASERHEARTNPVSDGGPGPAKAAEAVKPKEREPAEVIEATRPRPASINVLLPSAKGELVVRGEVGKGNPDEWYGPKRVIHSPPLDEAKNYLVGCFWTDSSGRPQTRSKELIVKPGRVYEVDLRNAEPTVKEVDR